MYPFVRDGERGRRESPPRSPGLMVTTPAGKRHFFPGTTEELCLVLAKAAFSDGSLDLPETTIEFGHLDGSAWFMESVIKAGWRDGNDSQ